MIRCCSPGSAVDAPEPSPGLIERAAESEGSGKRQEKERHEHEGQVLHYDILEARFFVYLEDIDENGFVRQHRASGH